MNYNKFQLLQFKLDTLVPDPAIVMIAKRGSGKSFIVRDIMYHLRHIPGGVVISPTDKMNPMFKMFFPDLYIHFEVTDLILQKILIRQEMMKEKMIDKKKRGLKVDPSSILVMDDCLAEKKKWAKLTNITVVLLNGRHYKLTYIFTMQYPIGLEPTLRLNFDYIFLLYEDSAINTKKLYDNYASIFPSQAIFEKVFSICTENYRSMVIVNRKPSKNIQDKVFWFKAEERKYSFGSKKFRELHKKYFDPEYSKKINARLLKSNLGLKNNGPDIGVVLK